MSELHISYSGIRGITGDSLTPEVARLFGRAFRDFLRTRWPHPRVVLARDTRASGPELLEAMVEGLQDLDLIDLGVVPTPTAQFALEFLQVEAAVVITASHNPPEWNGFKFMMGSPRGMVLDAQQIRELMDWVAREREIPWARSGQSGQRQDRHLEVMAGHRVAVLAQVDVKAIRSRKFRVAYDSGQGAGRESTLELLAELGCTVGEVTELRDSEPTPQNLEALCRAVSAQGAELGLAQDLDADRLALVTEQGRAPGEHLTLVMVVEHLLKRLPPGSCTVVKNLSTTRAIDDLVERHGGQLIEVPVGEVNLSRALQECARSGQTAFGGEGNGGVIYPPVGLGRDSLMGIAFVLEALALGPAGPLSERLARLPHYVQDQRKLTPTLALGEGFARLEKGFPQATASHQDGLKLNLPDRSWLALRASNTEPIWRLLVEGATAERVTELLEQALACLGLKSSA